MSEIEDEKMIFKPVIPDPTEADLAWAKRVNRWGFMRSTSKLRDIVDNNQIWRLNFLHEKYKDKLDLSYYYNRSHGSYCGESLIGRAVEYGHENMALLLSHWKAPIRRYDSVWDEVIAQKSKPMAYALLQYKKSGGINFFNASLNNHAYKVAQVFVDLGRVKYHDGLMSMVSADNFKAVEFLVKKGVDISVNNYEAIKEAEDNGYFKMADYLKESAGLIEKNVLTLSEPVPTPDTKAPKSGSDTYEKISDVELLKTSVSENGSMTLTTVFNFEMEDVTRTQYVTGQAPSQTQRKFNDFDDKACLKAMFDELVQRNGHPPQSGIFKAVNKRVKIKNG